MAYAAALSGCDAVVFAAGGGADGNIERKRTVDLGGSLKAIKAAGLAGVGRFVQVSSIGVDDPLPDDTAPVWKAYVEAKRDADLALRTSDLDWTILRPGRLTDDPGTGLVAHRATWNLVGGSDAVAEAVTSAARDAAAPEGTTGRPQ